MTADEKRPCTISESLEKSLAEMRDMREGSTKKRYWKDLSHELDAEIGIKRKTIREKKNLGLLVKKQIISVETSPATRKLNFINRLIRELFQ